VQHLEFEYSDLDVHSIFSLPTFFPNLKQFNWRKDFGADSDFMIFNEDNNGGKYYVRYPPQPIWNQTFKKCEKPEKLEEICLVYQISALMLSSETIDNLHILNVDFPLVSRNVETCSNH
jgi:hypothetical protein